MTRWFRLRSPRTSTEAEEIQAILAGGRDRRPSSRPRSSTTRSATEDAPQKVLVPESSLEAAQHAIEAMTDPDELVSDA